jgi:hypothetical protein
MRLIASLPSDMIEDDVPCASSALARAVLSLFSARQAITCATSCRTTGSSSRPASFARPRSE